MVGARDLNPGLGGPDPKLGYGALHGSGANAPAPGGQEKNKKGKDEIYLLSSNPTHLEPPNDWRISCQRVQRTTPRDYSATIWEMPINATAIIL